MARKQPRDLYGNLKDDQIEAGRTMIDADAGADEEPVFEEESPLEMEAPPPPPEPVKVVKPKGVPKPKEIRVPTPDGGEVRIKAGPPPKTQEELAREQQAEAQTQPAAAGGGSAPPRELSPLEMFGGPHGLVEVERVGPGKGRGWKGEKFKGRKVEFGRVGKFGNDSKLFDKVQEIAGGGMYKFVGTVNGRPVEITKALPGEPRPLTSVGDDEEIDEEEELAAMGLTQGMGMGHHPQQLPPGYGYPGQPQMLPGVHPGMFPNGMPVFQGGAPIWDNGKTDELKSKLEDERRKNEMAAITKAYEDKLAALKQPDNGPSSMMQMIQAQIDANMRMAAEERKNRAEEQRIALEREKSEREALRDREKLEFEREKAERETQREREKAEREAQERRDRQEREDREKRDAERRERDERIAREDRERQDKWLSMQMEIMKAQKPTSLKSSVGEMGEIIGLVDRLRNGNAAEPSRVQDAKEIIEAVGITLRDALVPALAQGVNVIRGKPADGGAAAPDQQIPQDQPAGQITHDPNAAHQTQVPVAPEPAKPTNPVDALTRDRWLEIIDMLVQAKKRGNNPKAVVPLLVGYCYKKIPFNIVAKQFKDINPAQLGNQLGVAAAAEVEEPVRALLLNAQTELSTDDGQKWFADFQSGLKVS